jgi:predicted nuclease with TOPRIM domain
MSEDLNKEIDNLKGQLAQQSQGIQVLINQLEAYKAHLTDLNNLVIQLRTQNIMFTKSNKELTDQVGRLQTSLSDANKRVAQLEAPVAAVDANQAAA